ncbi:eukaryotic aspartyl protease [Botrytis cinerea]
MGMCTPTQTVLLLVLGKYVTGVATATALSLTPSTEWYGDDGSWSAVSIRLGNPKQWVNLFPNTLSAETWAIGPYGCQDGDSTCLDSRGSIFNATQSSTWEPLLTLESSPYWRLGTGNSLQWPPYGEYGLENLAFGPDGPTIPNATVAMINATEYWVGSFGLGASAGNFSYITPNVTFAQLETLGDIVSAGYGYTAGLYIQKGEPMSLTLGGYDENRFISHDVLFTLTQNPPVPQVFLDSIFVISSNGSNTAIELVSYEDDINALIDSSTPYLWLPETVCDRFADALGLSYNESLNLYTFDENPTQHNNLSDSSTTTTFTFTFKDESSGSDFVEIDLPYAAFDLSLSYPYIPNTEYGTDEASKFYFPLARSANSSQYTIGRAFLQEAYIITSYETNQFSLHQAVHVADTLNNKSIIAIPSGDTTTGQGTGTVPSGQNTRLTKGQIAGIVIGVVGTVATLLVTLYFSYIKYYKPRKLALALKNSNSKYEAGVNLQQLDSPSPTGTYPSEAPGDFSHPVEINSDITQPTEVSAEVPHQRLELAAVIPKELSAETAIELPAELPADFSMGEL